MFRSLLVLPLLFGFASISAAAPPEGFRKSLFNGENLDGWQVTGCKAGVEEGLLVIQDGDGLVRTDHRYQDFILELEWRPRRTEKWDSGIYFRCELPPEGKPWPRRYQANLLQGAEGNVIGDPKAQSKGLVKEGQWNKMKLTVVGSHAEMEINGKSAWSIDSIEATSGYIAIQVEVPGGGQFEFKNFFITELGYQSLFNGSDLSGWEGATAEASTCWKAEQGLLVCTGTKGGTWLRSQDQWGDFNMRLEYRLKAAGNSGVYVRVPADGNHHGAGAGVEIQILDDFAERYKKLKDYQFTGSVYAIAPATKHVGRDPGQWNSLEINCKGMAYRIVHNGVIIVEADIDQFPDLKHRLAKGFLGLQNHSEEVWYRDLRIGPAH